MPIPVLKVDLDDAAFQRYLTAFHKYQAALGKQSEMWQGVNDSIKTTTLSGAAMAAEIAHQAEETRKLLTEEQKREQSAKRAEDTKRRADREQEKRDEEAAKRRRHAIDQVREYSRSITDAALSMGKWAVIGGAAGLAGGVLSMWGLDRLMAPVGEERRLAGGLGVSMGQRQGMGLNMQRYFDVNSTLETVSNMQANPSQWGTFRMMGINPQNKSPAELTYEAAIAARRMFQADKGNLALAQAQGLTNIFSADDLRRMASESPGQFNKSIRDSRRYQGLNDDTGRKWQNFQITVDTVKQKLANALIEPLTKFEPLMEKVIDGFGKMLIKLFNNPAVQSGIDHFAKWLGSPQFQKDMKEFADNVAYFAHKAVAALRLLGLLPDDPMNDEWRNGKDGAGPPGVPGGSGVVASGPLGKIIRTTEQSQYMTNQFAKWGWSTPQIKGLLSNISAESSFNPFAKGDKGTAYGLAQWHADRQADYAKLFGHTMQSVQNRAQALKEQTEFIHYELTKGKFKKAGDDLKKTQWAYSAGYVVSKEYERPGDAWGQAVARGAAAQMMTVNITVTNKTGSSVATTVNSAARGGK